MHMTLFSENGPFFLLSNCFWRGSEIITSSIVASLLFVICFLIFILIATLFVAIFLLTPEMPSLGVIYRTLGRDVRGAFLLVKILAFLKKCHLQNRTALNLFQDTVKKFRHKPCLIFEDEVWTFQQVDEMSNRIANYFLSMGYQKGDEVALYMDNCPEYVCIWLGLAKIGVVTALINTNLKEDTLAHSINVVDARAVIFAKSFANVINGALPFLSKDTIDFYCFSRSDTNDVVPFAAKSLNALLEDASPSAVDSKKFKITYSDKMLYIYTSGTTGLPKAAIIRHSRFMYISTVAKFVNHLTDSEVFYNPLPMYHTAGGVVFVSVVLTFGGSMVIRKKFSASNFWKEAVAHKATVGQYIGEICRYLLNQPVTEDETKHQIRRMFGNGLRPHIWEEFQSRFRIPNIIELYGATEGNANLINMFGKVGAVGFVSRLFSRIYPVFLIKVDPLTGEPIRNAKGLCILCKPGEPGELVGKIINNSINAFDGYANKKETEKKTIQDCLKKGDKAFLSGDILVMDVDGYLYFVDRTGDTFRWRGENVSTGEVENVVSKAAGYAACVVYGVEIPNVEGRAGMATMQIDPNSINMSSFYQEICKKLPSYAVPLFIRISQIETTGTYKLRKISLQKEGYDPEHIADPMYFIDHKLKTYIPLTADLYLDIINGKIRL